MASLIATLARIAFGPRPEIICDAAVWRAGVAELGARTLGGRRESGAFLLGSKEEERRRIDEFVFYDDIDPQSLASGIVRIDGRRLGDLWAYCRKTGRAVVADIHVHPGSFEQSASDQANPIIAEIGHIAIILPSYARGATLPGGIGVHEYRGSRTWSDRSAERPSPFHVGWWPRWA